MATVEEYGFRQKLVKRIAESLHQKRLWLYWAILAGLTILYCLLFWHLPMSEDAGLYGYLSRAIANGMVLHRDVFFSSNSIAIYVTALVFKIFGSSLDLYRLIHATGLLFLVSAVYLIVSRDKKYERGFLAAVLTSVFCVLPHIILDLGRNYIVWATAFLLVGFYVYSTNIRRKEIYAGVLLGTAALIRETFVLAGVVLLIYEIGRLLFLKWQRRTVPYRAFLTLSTAFMLTLCLNAVILTCFGTWEGYFRDMLHSGTSFRYEAGILDPDRIADNISRLRHGFNNFYYPVLLLGGLSYFVTVKDSFVSYIKYLLIPVFIVEAIIVNRTAEYSIIPILVFASVLSTYYLSEVKDILLRCVSQKAITVGAALLTSALLLLSVDIISCATRMSKEFRAYYVLSQKMAETDLSNSDEHTERILYAVSLLPNATVAAYSEYPFLFLTKKFYGSNPFVQDPSASANLNRPDIWQDQLDYLRRTPTELLILKTSTNSYLSKYTDLGRIIDQEYIMVCDFPFAPGPTAYKNRVLLSKSAFNESYTLWIEETAERAFEGFNDRCEGIIVGVSTSVPEDIKACSITAGLSLIQYAEEYTSELVLYCLVPPGSTFKIEAADGTDTTSRHSRQLQIRYYVRNGTE